jgi:hypothetical protein
LIRAVHAGSEGSAFGENAHRHQAIGLLGAIVAGIALFFAAGQSLALTVFLSLVLAASIFWYVIPGHACIYGPYLFVFGFISFAMALLRLVSRRER